MNKTIQTETLCAFCYYARMRTDICGIYCTGGYEGKGGNMTVTATAFKTIGLGCIEGDAHTNEAQRVEDKGTYYEVIVHENRSIRYTKNAWALTIKE